jgi:hypothetical protein
MGSVNYIFANTGQTVRLVVQVLDSNGYPVDLDGYGNWLDGYGYLLPDGYYSDPPDGYYPDGYDGYCDGYHHHHHHLWTACVRHTTDHDEWHRWWNDHNDHNHFDHDNCFDGYHCNDHHRRHHHDCFHVNYRGPNDGYYVPVVQRVIFPDFSKAAHYPRPMTRIGTGLYVHGLCIPNGVPAIGTYIASVSWTEKDAEVRSEVGFGYATLVDGYVSVTPPGGLPEDAVITFSRESAIGSIGEITIVPGSQTTTQFSFASTSSYDESIIAWTWNSGQSSFNEYKFKWETYAINASRPFGVTSVSPV